MGCTRCPGQRCLELCQTQWLQRLERDHGLRLLARQRPDLHLQCGASLRFLGKVPAWIAAESDCYKNKHASLEAASFHFNLSRIYELINRIDNG